MIKFLPILILFFFFVRCNVNSKYLESHPCNSNLIVFNKPYINKGYTYKTEGIANDYHIVDSTLHCTGLVFFKNGVVRKHQDFCLNWNKSIYDNNNKKSKSGWGVYNILGDSLIIKSWDFGENTPLFLDEFKLLTTSRIVLIRTKRLSESKKYISVNDTFDLSVEPLYIDSVNVYIK